MAKVRDIAKMGDGGKPVTISRVMLQFGISEEQAWKAIKACWDRGLLMPTTESWFLQPVDGRPVRLGAGEGNNARADYFKGLVEKIRERVEAAPDMGVSINDLVTELDANYSKVSGSLRVLVDNGELIMAEATAGGLYGKRPKIYAKTVPALEARNQRYIEAESERKSKKRKRKKKETTVDLETGEILTIKPRELPHRAEVDFQHEEW